MKKMYIMQKTFALSATESNWVLKYYSCPPSLSNMLSTKWASNLMRQACLLFLCFFTIMSLNAQNWDYNSSAYNATSTGYFVTGAGTYYKGTSGGTVSTGTIASCNGYTVSVPTSSGVFWFQPSINITAITVYGIGTGSGRSFSAMATSSSLNGTYTAVSGASGTGTIGNTTCGNVIFNANSTITAGTFVRLTFTSGNVNMSSIVVTPALSAPTVTTTAVTSITPTTAASGGTVTNNGNATVTAQGVVWGTSLNPTTNSNLGITSDGTTTPFSSSITGLSSGATYHVRAYATNSQGTAYGSDLTFTTTVATTNYYNASNSDVTVPANWGTNIDGSGSHPSDFVSNGQIFNLVNTGSSMSAAWTVSGASSKIVFGDGAVTNSFTIPSAFAVAGSVDVNNKATLVIQNTSTPTFGTIATGSSIVFDGSDALTIPAVNYFNLSSTNDVGSSRTLASSGTIGVAGTFIPGSATYTITGSTVSFNGVAAQVIPTFTFNKLSWNNAAGCSIAAGTTVSIGSGGAASVVATSGLLTVNGTLTNTGTSTTLFTTTTSTLNFGTTGVYNLTGDGGQIPTATWNTASTINITGVIAGSLTNTANSTYGNYIYNCAGQTAGSVVLFTQSGINIAGSFTFNATGTGLAQIISSSGTNFLTVSGDYIQHGGIVLLNPSSAVSTVRPMVVLGNFTIDNSVSAPTFRFSSNTATANVIVKGNVTLTNATIENTSGATSSGPTVINSSNFYFAGSGTQTYTRTGGTFNVPGGTINFFINSGATVDLGTSIIGGTNFTNNGPYTYSAFTGTTASGTNTITAVSSVAGLQPGMTITGTGIPANTIITDVGVRTSTTIGLSKNATAAGTVTFTVSSANGSTIKIGDAAGITSSGATGNIQVSGARTFSTSGNYEYNGPATQVTGEGLPSTVNNLTINNVNGVSLSSAATVSGTLTVNAGTLTTGANNLTLGGTATLAAGSVLSITGGITDFAGKPVTLQSSSAGTASIGTISGTLSNATNVTVERYIPSSGRKSYTMVTSPVSGPTINAAWQEAGAATAGYGTQITGAAAGNGFDAASASGFASIFTYNDANATGSKWVGLTNTNVNTLAPGAGYLLYVRGDRTVTPGSASTGNTTLRATGTLTTGDFTPVLTTTAASKFNLIANPYPCAVKWSALTKPNLTTTFYVYDPNKSMFVTYNSVGNVLAPSDSKQLKDTIQSGEAFFIQNASSGTPSITFTEASKVVGGNTASDYTVFSEEAPASQLNINIYSKNNNELADGVVAIFGNSYKAGLGKEDAAKMDNFNETFALTRNNNRLSIEGRPMVKGNDTLFFAMNNFSKKEYTFKIDGSNFSEANATLLDNYTGTKTALDLAGISTYNFTVNGDAASTSNDRFMITFGSTATIAAGETADNNNSLFVKVGPSPVSNQLQVNFKTAATETAVIKVINSLGQTVKTVHAGKVNAGNITIPVAGLSSGIYTVQLLSGNTINTRKIVKQ